MATDTARDPDNSILNGMLLALLLVGALVGGRYLGRLSAGWSGDGLGTAASTAWQGWRGVVLNPWYWAFLGVLCILQWRFPARRELPGLSVGLGQDLVWFLASSA